MKTRLLASILALAVALVVTEAAVATTRAPTTLTIKAKNGDIWGTISSTRPKKCAKDRKVVVFKQVGTVQDPTIDTKVASWQNGHYEWSIGNSGTFGKVYARAPRTLYCKAGSSDTIKSIRST
jgi:hypothetical protein